jgi:hypothetical protein
MLFWVFRSDAADVFVTTTSKDPSTLATLMPEIERLIDGVELEADAAETSHDDL